MDIVAFYRVHDPRTDAKGRKLITILNWSDEKLESCHDYIQVIFPLPEPSTVIFNAPIIDERVCEVFNSRNKEIGLHSNLQRAFLRMLKFYGFELPEGSEIQPIAGREDAGVAAVWAENYSQRFTIWIRPGHNHLRITRIIRSLRVLGRQDLAKVFLDAIESVWSTIEYQQDFSKASMEWWYRAFNWPLYSPPQGEEGEVGTGLGWLKEIVDAQETS